MSLSDHSKIDIQDMVHILNMCLMSFEILYVAYSFPKPDLEGCGPFELLVLDL